MLIRFEIEDGYTGKSRPQKVDVPDCELEECETRDDQEDLIERAIQAWIDERVYGVWSRDQLDDAPRPRGETTT